MPSLKDLLNSLREIGVLPDEIKVPRKTFGNFIQQGEELAEEDSKEEE